MVWLSQLDSPSPSPSNGGSPDNDLSNDGGDDNRGTDPTDTPTPAGTPFPTATATPSSIDLARIYIQYSPLGKSLYDYMIVMGITIDYSGDCKGHSGNPITVPDSLCSGKSSPTFVTGTIAHEIAHDVLPGDGTLFQEYQAMLVGDIVRNDLIQAGYGTSADMRHQLSVYTVNLNNPNKDQLKQDIETWFSLNDPAYVDPKKYPTPIPILP